MKKEYPKVIYKNGIPDDDKNNYKIVNDYEHHQTILKEWGAKGPDKVAKNTEKADNKQQVSDNSDFSEVKPRRKKKAKKAKKSVKKEV